MSRGFGSPDAHFAIVLAGGKPLAVAGNTHRFDAVACGQPDDLVQRGDVQDRNTVKIRIELAARQPLPCRQIGGNSKLNENVRGCCRILNGEII